MAELTQRASAIRAAIAGYIESRREAKLKGKDGDVDLASKYEYETWLASAAARAKHLQSVTHVLKATHPSAKGSNVYVQPGEMLGRGEVGTHSLGPEFAEDTAVADAKHLDVFSLLKLPFEGRRVLDWLRDGDVDIRVALHSDPAVADRWIKAFKGLIRVEERLASHAFAKQVYWLAGESATQNDQYHLLQPMFSSALAHAVHGEIQDARFGESNKLARQAFRAKEAHEGPYRDYRSLAVRKLGGTKPQNVSQLNSERGGINYLLASLPPTWSPQGLRIPLGLTSMMDRFAYFKGTRRLLKSLADFLLGDPPPNGTTRSTRRAIEQELAARLALFAAEIRMRFEPGWSRDPECVLASCEKLWLDPERVELPVRVDPEHPEWEAQDREFIAAYDLGNWPDEVAGQFANWVNARLRDAGLTTVGDAEFRHWARQVIVDAAWPVPTNRRAPMGGEG